MCMSSSVSCRSTSSNRDRDSKALCIGRDTIKIYIGRDVDGRIFKCSSYFDSNLLFRRIKTH